MEGTQTSLQSFTDFADLALYPPIFPLLHSYTVTKHNYHLAVITTVGAKNLSSPFQSNVQLRDRAPAAVWMCVQRALRHAELLGPCAKWHPPVAAA